MTTSNIEQRLQALETEVAELKRRLAGRPSPTEPWWRQISGIFAGDPAFDEAMKLGRQWRERENARSLYEKSGGREKSRKMFALDSDHMSFLSWPDSKEAIRIRQRMEKESSQGVVTTIVTYEEQTRGWLAYSSKAKSVVQLVDAYKRLENHLTVYMSMPVLGFDAAAAIRFQELKLAKTRVGTLDLRIASIALVRGATLVTRNARDFGRVPGLKTDDWTVDTA